MCLVVIIREIIKTNNGTLESKDCFELCLIGVIIVWPVGKETLWLLGVLVVSASSISKAFKPFDSRKLILFSSEAVEAEGDIRNSFACSSSCCRSFMGVFDEIIRGDVGRRCT